MRTLLIRRRPDGVIELRRRRLRDNELVRDVTRLLGMFLFCGVFIAALAAALVVFPLAILVAAAFLLPSALAYVLGRSLDLHPATAPARPPTRPAA
jgi:hypothetical protein